MDLLALDLSLTGSGWAAGAGQHQHGTLTSRSKGPARLADLRDQLHALVLTTDPGVVVLEDYAYHGRMARSHELGEWGGVARLSLYEWQMPTVCVVPSSLKKYACGKGNANKEEMLTAAVRRLGYAGSSKDEADALWLWAMASDAYGRPPVDLPKANREALERVIWPPAGVSA